MGHKNYTKHFSPNHIGQRGYRAGGNKGQKYQNKTGESPQVIQTKGE